jgi:DNA (cytosine-5)-methyltransferase 1
MRYATVCSGIECASAAWQPLGWEPVFFSEIEPFPCAVLAHHHPDVPNYGDMTSFKEWPDADIDLLAGGTPCQSFSVAGLRRGLDDPRGNLMLTYLAIAARYKPRWLVWENVPGVLSSNGGRDFGAFLRGLGECGYGFAYRVLDAQYVRSRDFPNAVPQRRRRVFVVGYLGGDWRRAAAVLFDRESLSGNCPPRRKPGQGFAADAAPCLTSSGRGVKSTGDTRGQDPVVALPAVANPLTARMHKGINTTLDEGQTPLPVAFDMRGREGGAMPQDTHNTANIRAASGGSSRSYVAVHGTQDPCVSDGAAFALGRNNGAENAIAGPQMAVRRLTPTECERLMALPDEYTRIPYRGKPADQCPDGPRYKALGNGWAANVAQWVGERIEMVEALSKTGDAA